MWYHSVCAYSRGCVLLTAPSCLVATKGCQEFGILAADFPSLTLVSWTAAQRTPESTHHSCQRVGRCRLTGRYHAMPENTKTVCFPCTLLGVSLFDCNRAVRARTCIYHRIIFLIRQRLLSLCAKVNVFHAILSAIVFYNKWYFNTDGKFACLDWFLNIRDRMLIVQWVLHF